MFFWGIFFGFEIFTLQQKCIVSKCWFQILAARILVTCCQTQKMCPMMEKLCLGKHVVEHHKANGVGFQSNRPHGHPSFFFWLPARVRVPGGSPFSQLQQREKDNSTFVKSNKNIYSHWPEQ